MQLVINSEFVSKVFEPQAAQAQDVNFEYKGTLLNTNAVTQLTIYRYVWELAFIITMLN